MQIVVWDCWLRSYGVGSGDQRPLKNVIQIIERKWLIHVVTAERDA